MAFDLRDIHSRKKESTPFHEDIARFKKWSGKIFSLEDFEALYPPFHDWVKGVNKPNDLIKKEGNKRNEAEMDYLITHGKRERE